MLTILILSTVAPFGTRPTAPMETGQAGSPPPPAPLAKSGADLEVAKPTPAPLPASYSTTSTTPTISGSPASPPVPPPKDGNELLNKQVVPSSVDEQAQASLRPLGRVEISKLDLVPGAVASFTSDLRFALSSTDRRKTCLLWDVKSGKVLHSLSIYDFITVSSSLDGRLLLFVRDDDVVLWDAKAGKELQCFKGHSGGILKVAISPDGLHVLTGGRNGTVRFWDVGSGNELRRLPSRMYVDACVFSPDGKTALSGDTNSTESEHRLRLWDTETAQLMRTFTGPAWYTACVAFSPDGRCAVSGDHEGIVWLWDVQSGIELKRFEDPKFHVCSVAFSPDGRSIACSDAQCAIRVWDIVAGSMTRRFFEKGLESPYDLCKVAFSPDGTRVNAAGGNGVIVSWPLE